MVQIGRARYTNLGMKMEHFHTNSLFSAYSAALNVITLQLGAPATFVFPSLELIIAKRVINYLIIQYL